MGGIDKLLGFDWQTEVQKQAEDVKKSAGEIKPRDVFYGALFLHIDFIEDIDLCIAKAVKIKERVEFLLDHDNVGDENENIQT